MNALYGPNAAPLQSRELLARGIATTGAPHFSGKRQYTLSVQVSEFRQPGSLKIYAFFGSVTSKIDDWPQEPGFVGVTSILAATKDMVQEAHSVIPLTPALETSARAGVLASLDEGEVAAYLIKYLRWKVVKVSDSSECNQDRRKAMLTRCRTTTILRIARLMRRLGCRLPLLGKRSSLPCR